MTTKALKTIIVAMDEKNGIGKDGKIPWYFPEDFKHFKEVTKNGHCIMGRKTFEEIAEKFDYKNTGKFLPGRKSYVISSKDESDENIKFFKTVKEAVDYIEETSTTVVREIFFLGGEKIFEEALSICPWVYITRVKGDYNCDRFFPWEKFQEGSYINIKNKESINHGSDLIFEMWMAPWGG